MRDGAGQYLREIDQALIELFGVFRDIAAVRIDAEVEQLRQSLGISDAIGQLTLQRDILKISRDFIEDKRHIHARQRHLHNDRPRREIIE